MQKLNKMFLFVLLSFCLLINVSSAFTLEANVDYKNSSVTKKTITSFANYSSSTINTVCMNYYNDSSNSDYISAFNDMISAFAAEGYDKYFIESYKATAGIADIVAFFFPSSVDVCINSANSSIYFCFDNSDPIIEWRGTTGQLYKQTTSSSILYGFSFWPNNSFYTNVNVKQTQPSTLSGYFYWDGTSYFYKVPSSDEPDTPTMPTNAEIAQAVQLFNDNVFDEEKTGQICGFSDFFVLYDKSTKKYTYIGHGMGNSLGQLIVAPDYHYEGYKFNKQWWKFFKDTESNDYNIIRDFTKYFVYTSEGTLETLTYIGASNISGLIDKSGPWATDNTIIVYSTVDYPVKNVTFDSSTYEPIIETGTIEGDQYTYDENLDITDNNYNPLDNFITVDPIDTVIGNVNFSEINKTFEENKGILNIENASWLFTANNKLIGYFTGFLSLLIVFLIISRALGG